MCQLLRHQVFLVLSRLEEAILDKIWDSVLSGNLNFVLSLGLLAYQIFFQKGIIILMPQKSNQSIEITEIA